ncbi:MAG TPA: SLC13 family permease [Planctomycetota bacterium]|nr:SLC13 family permease [Planctomycetota bacterium]
MQPYVVSALVLVAAFLFVREVWTVDVITLLMVLALIATGIITTEEAFAGFASEIIVVLAALFVVTGALQDSGVIDSATQRLLRGLKGAGESRIVATLMGVVAALSSVMNNTTVTGLMVGPTSALARRIGTPASRLLMPLAFASMMGGMCTLIGTSTNVAVSGRMPAYGLEPIRFFEITPLGAAMVLIGVLWMAFVGRRSLPHRAAAPEFAATIADSYLSEMIVLPDSPLIGKRLGECGFGRHGIRVLRIVRGGDFISASNSRKLLAGDVLLFTGNADALIAVKGMEGIEIHAEVQLGSVKGPLEQGRLAEAVVLPGSHLVGRTLRNVALHEASGAVVLGLHRRGRPVHQPLGDIEVHVGDVLLLQGDPEDLAHAQRFYALAFTSAVVSTGRLRRTRGQVVAAFFLGAIAVAALDLAPLSVAFLAAAVVTVVSRCLDSERALDHVQWRLLILIGGMTAFGTAIEKSGADQMYAAWIEQWLAPYGPIPVLAGFMLLTMLLSQMMSNAAAALVVLPVAVATANRLDLDPRAFAIGVMIASSIALATPFEPSCVLVYGPGRYRFRDYFVTGMPLSLILLAAALVLLPILWPLRP